MIETEYFGDIIPKGYTGIVKWSSINGAGLAIDGSYLSWSDLESPPRGANPKMIVSWHTHPSYVGYIYYVDCILPIIWNEFKDHPVLSKVLMTYMLGNDK